MDVSNISLPPMGNLMQGASQGGNSPAVPAPAAAPSTPDLDGPQPVAPTTAQDARLAEVQKAAQVIQANYYVVSDVTFTIFKDSVGDYVTRYTSLKDGKVTYYPQKSLLELMKIRAAQEAIFETKV